MKKNPQAILIDLDDTIIVDDSLSVSVWHSVCQQYALIIGKVTGDELYTLIRAVTTAYWSDPEKHRVGRLDLYQTRRELVARALIESGLGPAALGHQIADAFSSQKDRLITPLPGAIETLQKLKANHVSLALVTNGGSAVQRSKIERFNLAHYFNYILVEGEFGAGKPDRRVYETCLRELKAEACESWMVGDDLNRDIGGAMQAGLGGIWVDWRKKGLNPDSPVKPDLIISSLTDLPLI